MAESLTGFILVIYLSVVVNLHTHTRYIICQYFVTSSRFINAIVSLSKCLKSLKEHVPLLLLLLCSRLLLFKTSVGGMCHF